MDGIIISSSNSGHHHDSDAVQCHDVDECVNRRLNTCPSNGRCINFDGGYRCECNNNQTDINGNSTELNEVDSSSPSTPIIDHHCHTCTTENGVQRVDGERWHAEGHSCSTCHCSEGVVTCEAMECNCDDHQMMLMHLDGQQLQHCCPQCSGGSGRSGSKVCLHQEDRMKVFTNGERWNYDCQTCECMVSVFVCRCLNVF